MDTFKTVIVVAMGILLIAMVALVVLGALTSTNIDAGIVNQQQNFTPRDYFDAGVYQGCIGTLVGSPVSESDIPEICLSVMETGIELDIFSRYFSDTSQIE